MARLREHIISGTAVRDLPRMAAVSKEAIAMSVSFLGKRGYAIVKSRPAASGGKLLLLTSTGRKAQETYRQRVWAIEERWRAQFGRSAIGHLRESLESLVGDPSGRRSPLFRGVEPYPMDGGHPSQNPKGCRTTRCSCTAAASPTVVNVFQTCPS
jgi:hypothetical protein